MSSSSLTVREIISAYEAKGNDPLFKVEYEKMRKADKQATFYYPLLFRRSDGVYIPLRLKFNTVLSCSNANFSSFQAENPTQVSVVYRAVSEEDLKDTEYKEHQKATLVKKNEEFAHALNIIADAYHLAVKEFVSSKHKNVRESKPKSKKISCFRQTHRERKSNEAVDEVKEQKSEEDEDEDEDIVPLENPLFRVSIAANPTTKELGRYIAKEGRHIYTVYDLRKKTADGKPMYAKVASGKDANGNIIYKPLDVYNAKNFITYMSLTGGLVTFDSICVSSSYISMPTKFFEMFVLPHRKMKMNTLEASEIDDMTSFGDLGYSDDTAIVDEPVEAKKSPGNKKLSLADFEKKTTKKVIQEESEDVSEDEPEDNQDEPMEAEPEEVPVEEKQEEAPPKKKKGKKRVATE